MSHDIISQKKINDLIKDTDSLMKHPSMIDRRLLIRGLLVVMLVYAVYQLPWTYFSDGTGFVSRVLEDPNPDQDVLKKLYIGVPMFISYAFDIIGTAVILFLLWQAYRQGKTFRQRLGSADVDSTSVITQLLGRLHLIGIVNSINAIFLTSISTILSWLQYMLYLGEIRVDILLWISSFALMQGAILSLVVYFTWEAFVVDPHIRRYNLIKFHKKIGLSYGMKIITFAFVVPFLTVLVIAFPGYFLRHVLSLSVSANDDLLLTQFSILTGVITILIELPFVINIIRINQKMIRVFEGLKPNDDHFLEEKQAFLKIMSVQSDDENAFLISLFNEFILDLSSKSASLLSSTKKSEEFFKFIAESLHELNETSNSITQSMENVNDASQEQARLLQDLEDQLEVLGKLYRDVLRQSKVFRQKILQVTSKLQVLSLNVSIESGRAGKDVVGLDPLSREINQLSKETRSLNESLLRLIDEKMEEIQAKLEEIINRSNSLAHLGQNMVANAEEVTAMVEEEAATIREINERTIELKDLLEQTTKKFQAFTKIERIL